MQAPGPSGRTGEGGVGAADRHAADEARDAPSVAGASKTRGEEDESQDLQSLLAASLRQLADATRATRSCAWMLRPTGELYVGAAFHRDATAPEAPDAGLLPAVRMIQEAGRAIDLGEGRPGSPLHALAARHGMSCAAPLTSRDGEPVALILLGGPQDPPGKVRPRTLAAVELAVRRLHGPAMADAAVNRLRKLDDEVCRLDRLASLGDLLAEVAHEIRNPLVSVKTFMQLLPDHLHDEEFHGEFREMVAGELGRMERLLDMLIRHAKPGESLGAPGAERTPTRPEAVVESMVKLLNQRAAEREVTLEVELGNALPALAIGEDPLRQILLNVLLNALDAAPSRSRVTLRSGGVQEGRLELFIDDQGAGIAPELRARLFEPFFSTRKDRVGGLGLAISRKLAEEAGGTIRADETEEGGARFRLQLPVANSDGSQRTSASGSSSRPA